jgi:LuxR family maltose regulon positive regulatory protein
LAALREGNLEAATVLAKTYELPILQARLHLAKGEASTALESLRAYRQQMETKGWVDERLKAMVLEAVALQSLGETGKAIPLFGEALRLAEPGGFIRIFLDEGIPMAHLLSEAVGRGVMPDYARKLLAAFEAELQMTGDKSSFLSPQPLIEPLSQREVEILRLIAQGLSNREIGERLFLALNTVKGYNRKIFGKLQVQRRTEAIARARELGLL